MLTYTVNTVYDPEPTQAQLKKIKPAAKDERLKYIVRKVNITVTVKKTKKQLATFHGETNYK